MCLDRMSSSIRFPIATIFWLKCNSVDKERRHHNALIARIDINIAFDWCGDERHRMQTYDAHTAETISRFAIRNSERNREREREEKGKRINLFILIRSNARRIGTNNNHRLARASSAPLKSDLRSFRFVFIYTTRCDFELFVLFLDFHLFLFRAKVRTREIP